MMINDPLILEYKEKWGFYWTQGNETFYNPDTRELICFDDIGSALSWADKHHPKLDHIINFQQPPTTIDERAEKHQLRLDL